jgi:hypothetical protein
VFELQTFLLPTDPQHNPQPETTTADPAVQQWWSNYQQANSLNQQGTLLKVESSSAICN